jgi:hypothetical protein
MARRGPILGFLSLSVCATTSRPTPTGAGDGENKWKIAWFLSVQLHHYFWILKRFQRDKCVGINFHNLNKSGLEKMIDLFLTVIRSNPSIKAQRAGVAVWQLLRDSVISYLTVPIWKLEKTWAFKRKDFLAIKKWQLMVTTVHAPQTSCHHNTSTVWRHSYLRSRWMSPETQRAFRLGANESPLVNKG